MTAELGNVRECLSVSNSARSRISQLRQTLQEHNIQTLYCIVNREQICTVFLQSDTAATIFFLLLTFVWLLFKGGVYFFGKPTDINDG